jgi:hypothetical protein
VSKHTRQTLVVLLVLSALMPSTAVAAHSRLLTIAERSVAALQQPVGTTTAFAFGVHGLVAAAPTGASVRAITSDGAVINDEISASRAGLGVAHVPSLPLTVLIASRAGIVSASTPKYILGPPLGYETARIRSIRMPTVRLTDTHERTIKGSLPQSFAGAPVLTAHGRLIGAVAGIGTGTWEFMSVAMLKELTAVHERQSVPLVPILIGGLAVFLGGAAFGLSRAKRRRHREEDLRSRQRRARGRSEGPLVRLRTPSEEEDETHAEDDFEVIVKPRKDDS